MPPLFWTGKLTLPVKILMNLNCIIASINGSARDIKGMKERVKSGYDGHIVNNVQYYDDLGINNQLRAAKFQLEGLNFAGNEVLDVAAGTGALSFLLLEKGAKRVVCGDISEYMLEQCRKKAVNLGIKEDRMGFRVLDAEDLPFADNTFDIVITGMATGLFPDLPKAIREMVRVVKPGGTVSIGAHGPEHYWEPMDNFVRSTRIRYIIGYRPEWWPRTENQIRNIMVKAGLSKVNSKRELWRNKYPTGGDAWDFFCAISSSFQYEKYPPDKRLEDYQRVKDYFNKHNKTIVTDDIILAYGIKG